MLKFIVIVVNLYIEYDVAIKKSHFQILEWHMALLVTYYILWKIYDWFQLKKRHVRIYRYYKDRERGIEG